MKFYLVGGEVKFPTHKIEWKKIRKERNEDGELVDVEITETRDFYDADKKDAYIARLAEREIEFAVTELEQPSQEIIDRVEGRKFNTIEEARKAIDGTEFDTEAFLMAKVFELETKMLEAEVGE